MRTLSLCLLLALGAAVVRAEDQKKVEKVSDDEAKQAIEAFKKEFKTRDIEVKQNAVYNLHDVPHPLVLKELAKLLKNKDARVRNVAALAVGGHGYDIQAAGKVLMDTFKRDYKTEQVVGSVLQAMQELKYMKYWPDLKKSMKDKRNAVVIWSLGVLGSNKDYRALPTLLDMYQVAMPKKVTWKTGEVKVDTGAAGDADQKAAEAKFNAKYGRGGSKEKAKAKRKAKAFDERNFSDYLRKTVKAITGEDFDNAFDFEDWYVENYIKVHRRIAEMNGTDVAAAERKARAELPPLKAKIEAERKKLEEELAEERKNAK